MQKNICDVCRVAELGRESSWFNVWQAGKAYTYEACPRCLRWIKEAQAWSKHDPR